ncbi:MAG: cell surface polysaccharide biosynthesis protein [Myxococcales bacterium]
MTIPLNDLSRIHEPLWPELLSAATRVLQSGRYILGPEVEAFEAEAAATCGTRHAVGVSSGTDALLATLMAMDIQPGDEVITTPFTFISTAEVIQRLGAIPVFADIDPGSFNLDPQAALARVTPRTRAILPVHLFGRLADVEPLRAAGVPIIEDAAQAIGAATRDGRPAGSLGAAGCFSFFPAKNLGAFGDGGLVTTDDGALADRLRLLRQHGSHPRYVYGVIGGNFRLDPLQAALLRVKLPHLGAWTRARAANVEAYRRLFAERKVTVRLPDGGPGTHAWNQLCVVADDRDGLRAHLAAAGIATEIYYPMPLHLQPCFRHLGYRPGDLPHAEQAARSILALPVFPGLRSDELERVTDAICSFTNGREPDSGRSE